MQLSKVIFSCLKDATDMSPVIKIGGVIFEIIIHMISLLLYETYANEHFRLQDLTKKLPVRS